MFMVKNYMNVINKEFECAGRCSACVNEKRAVEYCRLFNEHKGEKAGVCINHYKPQPGQSMTQCWKIIGHKGTNALKTEPLVVSTCSEEKNVQNTLPEDLHPVVWNW